MAQNINIQPPQPATPDININTPSTLGTNGIGSLTRNLPAPVQTLANIGIGKLLQAAPDAVGDIGSFILQPSPAQLIKDFLIDVPPAPVNTMGTFGGATLNGGPIYSDLEIDSSSWTDFDGTQHTFPDTQFLTVLMSVQQNKNIIETQIQGSDTGAVLEYSGLGNYSITLNITITGSNGIYPQQKVENLVTILNAPIALNVFSWYLQQFNIFHIIIKSYDVAQEKGGISQQSVTVQAQSTNTPTLIIQ